MSHCLNCGTLVTGAYCHHCGQRTDISRLNTKTLLHETAHFFTHLEKHFFRTTWLFIAKPGMNSIHYLNGKRKRYQKPVSFFLIWAGVYILFHNLIINYFEYKPNLSVIGIPSHLEKANFMIRNNFTFFFLPALLLSAVIIYFFLGKPRFLFVETLVMCLFGAGCYNAICLLADFILGVLAGVNINSVPILIFQAILSFCYNFWFCFDLFKKTPPSYMFPRVILTALVISLLGWVFFVYFPLLLI